MDNVWPTYLTNLQTYTRTWATYGWIDPVGNLSGRPVYVFHGNDDTTVKILERMGTRAQQQAFDEADREGKLSALAVGY